MLHEQCSALLHDECTAGSHHQLGLACGASSQEVQPTMSTVLPATVAIDDLETFQYAFDIHGYAIIKRVLSPERSANRQISLSPADVCSALLTTTAGPMLTC